MKSDRLIIGLAVLVVLAICTAIVFGFLTTEEQEGRIVYLLLLGLPLMAVLMLLPRVALVVLALFLFTIRWLYDTWQVLPREATWVSDLLILLLVTRTLFLFPSRRERMVRVERMIYVLLGFAVVSAVLNGSSLTTFTLGLRMTFRYVLLFVAVYHLNLSYTWVKRYVIFLLVVGLVQTPVVVFQWRGLGYWDYDRISGTFGWGTTGASAFYFLVLAAFLLSRMMEEGRVRGSYVLVFLWMCVSPFLGEAKFFFLFIPVLVLFMFRIELIRRPLLGMGVIVGGIIMIVGMDYVVRVTGYWQEGRNPLTFLKNLSNIYEREMELGEAGSSTRAFAYVQTAKLSVQSPRAILFGSGPGSSTDFHLFEGHSPWINYYSRWGLQASRTISVQWLTLEYGYVGLVLVFVLLWYIFRRGHVLRRSPRLDLRVLGRTLESMVFMYVAWLFYVSAWQTELISVSFWPLVAMLVRLSYVEEARLRSLPAAVVASDTSAPEKLRVAPTPA